MTKEIEKITGQYMQNPVTMKIERVAAYVRVSTQEQKLHGLSLDAQKANLTKYAKEHNMKIVDWYLDEGVSGRKLIRNRPELQRMIKDAEKGRFDRIIFIKLDRFFRSVAEYHECMKRIAPILWTTTEEEYDLTTANGRMLVNMKLTIAEMEADQTGERIDLVNEYKVTTGQPLSGSMPFGFKIVVDPENGRKKIIRDPDDEPILRDLIEYYKIHQSRRKCLVYLQSVHHISMPYNSLVKLLENTMLCGEYRGNPTYCEPYMTRAEFDELQAIKKKNIKVNTANNRTYLFSGLIKCPECGKVLIGSYASTHRRGDKKYYYKRYRCPNQQRNRTCGFGKAVHENTLERLLLENIEQYFDDAKIRVTSIEDSDKPKEPTYNVDEIMGRIDRLNYSWQTGKISTVEKYEADFAELQELLEKAHEEQSDVVVKDFGRIEEILSGGWREIYNNLQDEYKRAFWRSFIRSIEIQWTTDKKKINRVNFF